MGGSEICRSRIYVMLRGEPMSRILILGGYGSTGQSLARHLLVQSTAEIVIAGRHLERAQAFEDELNEEFGGGRVSAAQADAASRADLLRVLSGVELLLVAAPAARHAETVIQAALQSGVDYLDVQLDVKKLACLKAFAPEIKRAGRCFITEAGFHPGLPSALVRYAASQLERLDSAHLAGYLNIGGSIPYSEAVDELMGAFRDYQAQVYKEGTWTKSNSFDMRKVDFGGQIGVRRCYSMFFEELRELPEMIPSLREVGFYMSETHWMTDWIVTPLVLGGLKLAPRRGIRPLGRLMWWAMTSLPRPPHLVLIKAEATGELAGRPARIDVQVSHRDGYELTAIPVVACLLQYMDRSSRRPGLWMMGHLVDPVRLLKDMARMGASVSSALS
jgi:hypothetical protein